MPVTTVNRRLMLRLFDVLGLRERVEALGIVDVPPYAPDSARVAAACPLSDTS